MLTLAESMFAASVFLFLELLVAMCDFLWAFRKLKLWSRQLEPWVHVWLDNSMMATRVQSISCLLPVTVGMLVSGMMLGCFAC
jgi:hypothetical protein